MGAGGGAAGAAGVGCEGGGGEGAAGVGWEGGGGEGAAGGTSGVTGLEGGGEAAAGGGGDAGAMGALQQEDSGHESPSGNCRGAAGEPEASSHGQTCVACNLHWRTPAGTCRLTLRGCSARTSAHTNCSPACSRSCTSPTARQRRAQRIAANRLELQHQRERTGANAVKPRQRSKHSTAVSAAKRPGIQWLGPPNCAPPSAVHTCSLAVRRRSRAPGAQPRGCRHSHKHATKAASGAGGVPHVRPGQHAASKRPACTEGV